MGRAVRGGFTGKIASQQSLEGWEGNPQSPRDTAGRGNVFTGIGGTQPRGMFGIVGDAMIGA